MRTEELTRQYLYELQELIRLIEFRIRREEQFNYKTVNITLPQKDLNNDYLMEDVKEYFNTLGFTFEKCNNSIFIKWD